MECCSNKFKTLNNLNYNDYKLNTTCQIVLYVQTLVHYINQNDCDLLNIAVRESTQYNTPLQNLIKSHIITKGDY